MTLMRHIEECKVLEYESQDKKDLWEGFERCGMRKNCKGMREVMLVFLRVWLQVDVQGLRRVWMMR